MYGTIVVMSKIGIFAKNLSAHFIYTKNNQSAPQLYIKKSILKINTKPGTVKIILYITCIFSFCLKFF